MNAEFNWWLLIVGVVGGAGLLWLVLGDWSRREEEVAAAERARESEWIAEALREEGRAVDPATAREVLRLHRTWLRETGAYDPLEDDEAAVDDRRDASDGQVAIVDDGRDAREGRVASRDVGPGAVRVETVQTVRDLPAQTLRGERLAED
jgi:hypothetical protein